LDHYVDQPRQDGGPSSRAGKCGIRDAHGDRAPCSNRPRRFTGVDSKTTDVRSDAASPDVVIGVVISRQTDLIAPASTERPNHQVW
jgi:hypothetical protein